MKIAIASGKGGTGKTTVAVNLYNILSKKLNNNVQLVDCDVEEPNDLLFFENAHLQNQTNAHLMVPEIDTEKCIFCKKCSDWCAFNAISVVKALSFAEVNKDLCHSCGACSQACNFGAIVEKPEALGVISEYETPLGAGVIEGRLEIGSSMQTALIKKVKKHANPSQNLVLFDAPPGTSCPVVETVSDADYIVLVTEPTPFGLYDLQLTVDLIEELEIPFGVVVNKAGLGNNDTYRFLEEKQIELLGNIPFSKNYAALYAKGILLGHDADNTSEYYQHTVDKLLSIIPQSLHA